MPKAKTLMYYTDLSARLREGFYRKGDPMYRVAAEAVDELVQLRQADRAEILRLRRLIESEVGKDA